MKGAVRRVQHVGITCSDLERSMSFYRDVLGCHVSEVIRRQGTRMEAITGVKGAIVDIAYVDAAGTQLELLMYQQPTRSGWHAEPCEPGFMHLALRVDDLDAAIEQLRNGGYEPVTDDARVAVYTRDPDGVTLELITVDTPAGSGR